MEAELIQPAHWRLKDISPQSRLHGLRHRLRTPDRNKISVLPALQNFGWSAQTISADYRASTSQRLNQHIRQTFPLRRQDKNGSPFHEPKRIDFESRQIDQALQAGSLNQFFQVLSLLPIAQNN